MMKGVEGVKRQRLDQCYENNPQLRKMTTDFLCETCPYKYSYNFSWLGRPI